MMADDNENVKNTATGSLGLTTTICTCDIKFRNYFKFCGDGNKLRQIIRSLLLFLFVCFYN